MKVTGHIEEVQQYLKENGITAKELALRGAQGFVDENPMDHYISAASEIQAIQLLCHGLSRRAGWWSNPATGEDLDPRAPHMVPAKLCLIHSEISEAMEGDRKNLMDDKLPHRKMIEVELADAMIRILDLAGALELDLGGAMVEKLLYNAQRADHKPENRAAENGKAY